MPNNSFSLGVGEDRFRVWSECYAQRRSNRSGSSAQAQAQGPRHEIGCHFPSTMSSIPPSSSSFQPIFSAALSEYAKQTGIDLATCPSAQTLQNCRSADNILDLLQDKAEQFHAYRDGNHKLIGCLKPVVQVLHSFSGFLAGAASLVSPCEPIRSSDPPFQRSHLQAPFPPASAILVGVDVLLVVCISPFFTRLRLCNISVF